MNAHLFCIRSKFDSFCDRSLSTMHDQRFIFVLSYRKKSQVVQGNCNWIEDVIPKMPYDSISSSSVRSAQ